ncbi:hypothetical protein DKX38_026534 [Salix brachista]|uniref:RNA helicase n=1 Tax=Salix brachista TaxID=2182728 RepID=A0A5N5JBP3_9ROSI|nr:hypothetical protein DKX38_026534 [Salix brachista]
MGESPSSSSSRSSSRSAPFPQSNFASLPVMALKDKIVEKILENRVTLIVGDTGCGKSSQVPQFLLEANVKPILCTQPRRFAVVAVAKMVSEARNCELGAQVGYHIGHSKLMSPRSEIVFKTAGVLLDEMRDKGLSALNYKAIILDEVHERSVESDLVLVCVKQFLLKNNDLRVVLMSATADIARYRDYFKDLGRGERVEVNELLGVSSDLLAQTYCSGPNPSMAATDIKPEVHRLILDLILHIHKNEPDIEKGILVFLPTYYDLEQQWHRLKPLSSSFKVHILHGSIDTKQALKAMKILKSHRKVILATNIAESSVTIPKVAYVIDSCRSLQVFWDATRKKDSTELVWVSKSQANQRQGRTGRTCDGQIYRLVTRSFFNKLEDYECPAILRLSLRQQVLLMCCAESRAINDPKVLLQKALDPPDPEFIEDALNLLVRMKALDGPSPRGRYEPTFYGRLLASFPLSFDASVLVLKFADSGLLQQGILLGILSDTQPQPIFHPFGEEHLVLSYMLHVLARGNNSPSDIFFINPQYTEYVYQYYGGDCNYTFQIGRKEMILIGNLGAYQFWQHIFKDKHRLERLKHLLKIDEIKATTVLLPKIEEEWCTFHNLVQSSLHNVSEMYEDILNSLHRFRPKFLGTCNDLLTYYDSYEFKHTCLLKCQPKGDNDIVIADDEHEEPSHEMRKCFAVPFVSPSHFQTIKVAENLSNIIKEIRAQHTDSMSDDKHEYIVNGSHGNEEASLCIYFMRGFCSRGSQCLFSHSAQAKRVPCKFFFTLQGCRYGETCSFSHALGPSLSSFSSTPCMPEDGAVNAASLLRFLPTTSDGCVLLLDDTNLHFSSNLARHYDPCKIISTTCMSDTVMFDRTLMGIRILWGLRHPYQTIISTPGGSPIPWNEVKCILWLPDFDSYSENLERQKTFVQDFFEYLALRILADALSEVQVILTMNNIKFSQLQVEKLGRDSFFFLGESFPFDEASFGHLSNTATTRKRMMASKPISYVFILRPPADVQFDNYAAILQKHLHTVDVKPCVEGFQGLHSESRSL